MEESLTVSQPLKDELHDKGFKAIDFAPDTTEGRARIASYVAYWEGRVFLDFKIVPARKLLISGLTLEDEIHVFYAKLNKEHLDYKKYIPRPLAIDCKNESGDKVEYYL